MSTHIFVMCLSAAGVVYFLLQRCSPELRLHDKHTCVCCWISVLVHSNRISIYVPPSPPPPPPPPRINRHYGRHLVTMGMWVRSYQHPYMVLLYPLVVLLYPLVVLLYPTVVLLYPLVVLLYPLVITFLSRSELDAYNCLLCFKIMTE